MLGSFTPENLKQLSEREKSVEQLEKLGNIWIGPDIAIEKPVIINPNQLTQGVNIIVNKKDFPAIDITKGGLGSLSWSVRSFFAQTGVEISFHNSNVSDDMLKDINSSKNTLIPVDLKNYGQRPVEVSGNVMRFFWANDSKRLRGAELLNKVKSGEFVVDGVEGEDWFLGGYNEEDKFTTTGKGSDKGLCIVVRLKPEKLYIPHTSEPIKKDNTKSTRENLLGLLQPIPKGVNANFEIGETPRIKLGPNIVGVINLGVNEKNQKHIN
ncbi:hypothetical protein A2641_02265 [Candidatus Nomurabacteria bacterium RIFCSPHIGHO2_01_FULL_37_25]|uniref:Uncharacterized protein n=1 Tax=Candidatus Nomurabacteria bacterium RIFCSPLOWO2_01_FULL_36_16 TaxID=1801767 RepID=A0A1F6WY97_9BACT|nr:MAG: hypothetical protein A2641_02265 [Candidatus Nomurabacteria bacterium RIFCSPHIGHO2_01_FULL_37_25]OGI75814.1 MAG: hypothetical protein A3D36_00425 [Candidatus Nomurabacteria bacterium RIFCSPHIGHO2_02_FULL_36_29]OGI86754.1 MAG: hypothetical protein A3A91_01980 [Candidatus Nomurabacteria bacterium RIFCSPLOWO2_01_FULL_36_16]OGI96210.1 MAG: hypothetical protein A3I84_01970 [Candidatus Nomurabacteria bacterium RIFCSPLOWO2_02_FULL_36_8]